MTALVVSLIVVAASLLAGIAYGVRSARQRRRKVLAEDALKHLYHGMQSGPCTLNSLAGAMGRPAEIVAGIVADLTERKLMVMKGQELQLTDAGMADALSIIRSHRLWERYLADETTVDELDWHAEAEKQEHRLSRSQAESLSRKLGHPLFDPHGDPIPGPSGGIPSGRGSGLESFRPGDVVQIVHVEDEPANVFAELVRLDLFPGIHAVVREVTPEKTLLERNGEILTLSPVVAANLQVRKVVPRKPSGQRRTLASLDPGSRAVVAELSPTCRGLQRRRLLDLGIVPGTIVTAEMRSPGGDPTAYRIRGATIALRKEHAALVFLE